MTTRPVYIPFPTVKGAHGLCPYCQTTFRGIAWSWRMLGHILIGGCADPWGD